MSMFPTLWRWSFFFIRGNSITALDSSEFSALDSSEFSMTQ
jgi:hypothetical protein